MKKKSLTAIVAQNLGYFMARDDCLYHNPNALATATNGAVAANTIRNLLEPKRRTVTAKKPDGYPMLDTLEALAAKLPKCETWMLIHPDLKRALRAQQMYEKYEADYREQQKEAEKEPTLKGTQSEAQRTAT